MDGISILNGILQGLGGAGSAISQQRELEQRAALERERLRALALEAQARREQHEASLNEQKRQFDESRFTDIGAILKAAGIDTESLGPTRVPTSVAGAVVSAHTGRKAKEEERDERLRLKAEEEAKIAKTRDFIARSGGSPAVPPPDDGAMYDAGKPATPPLSREQLAAGLAGTPNIDTLMKILRPERAPLHGKPGDQFIDQETRQVIASVPEKPAEKKTKQYHVETADGVFSVTEDDQGNILSKTRLGAGRPQQPQQPTTSQHLDSLIQQRQGMIRNGLSPKDPKVLELDERIAGIRGGVGSQPSAGERTDIADFQAMQKSVESLIGDVTKNASVLGNMVSNPTGTLRRAGSYFRPSLTTPEEKTMLANLAYRMETLRTQLIGASRTVPELRGLADALPDKWEPSENILPKLQAISEVFRSKLQERRAVLPAGGGGGARQQQDDPLGILR